LARVASRVGPTERWLGKTARAEAWGTGNGFSARKARGRDTCVGKADIIGSTRVL
jgi:hypothetical protein